MGVTSKTTRTVMTKHFKGDILITDPCYICKDRDISTKPKWEDYSSYKGMIDYPDYDGHTSKQFWQDSDKFDKDYEEWNFNNPDDWNVCEYGDNFEALGIHNYMTHNTLYGDWSCTVFNLDTDEPVGEFCADSGLVSVFYLDEVRKYNPNIDKWIEEHDWCATVIKNFNGNVSFEIVHTEGTEDEDSKWWKIGDKWTDDSLIVVGDGNINFTTAQTGL